MESAKQMLRCVGLAGVTTPGVLSSTGCVTHYRMAREPTPGSNANAHFHQCEVGRLLLASGPHLIRTEAGPLVMRIKGDDTGVPTMTCTE